MRLFTHALLVGLAHARIVKLHEANAVNELESGNRELSGSGTGDAPPLCDVPVTKVCVCSVSLALHLSLMDFTISIEGSIIKRLFK